MLERTITICLAVSLVSLFSSCLKKTCNGYGTLQLCNESTNTTQRMMIDGTNYGTIDVGECESISLAAGEHDVQLVGITGGSGCSAAKVIIVECQTEARTCRY
ncbi:MAG: hypothetical protein HYY40_11435 [Bacteroidetes bacterium]|nr:hypothetical protein [Bacteroidota bacterium]